jgi:hypothetical protein
VIVARSNLLRNGDWRFICGNRAGCPAQLGDARLTPRQGRVAGGPQDDDIDVEQAGGLSGTIAPLLDND